MAAAGDAVAVAVAAAVAAEAAAAAAAAAAAEAAASSLRVIDARLARSPADSLRSSASPCANPHSVPYAQYPVSEKRLHGAVLKRALSSSDALRISR